MKNKRLIFSIVVLLVLAFYVSRNIPRLFSQKNQTVSIKQGEVMVVFKPEVSEADARSMLQSRGLKESQNFFKVNYVTLYSKDDSLEEYAQNLKKVPMVQRAEVVGRGRGTVKPWIVVDFSRFVSHEEIDSLLLSFVNLYIDPAYYPMNIQTIIVPVGKEKYFAEILQKDPLIKYATENTVGKLD